MVRLLSGRQGGHHPAIARWKETTRHGSDTPDRRHFHTRVIKPAATLFTFQALIPLWSK
jgi:hypothetical protein